MAARLISTPSLELSQDGLYKLNVEGVMEDPLETYYEDMAASLISTPSIDWTQDDRLYKRVKKFALHVEDVMEGPLETYRGPSKSNILMCWLPDDIKTIVREAGKDKANNYSEITEFLLNWAKPKTLEYNSFRELLCLKQGSMNFEEFAANVRMLVDDCNFRCREDIEIIVKNFIVTNANSKTAYLEWIKAGPDATLDKTLEIYREDAAVQAHFMRGYNNLSLVQKVNAELDSRGREEDVHKLHGKRTKPGKKPRGYTARTCHWCGSSHKPRECPAYGKECLNCGIKNHFARVCNKRKKLTE